MSPLIRAFFVSVFGTGVSRILGFIRDVVITNLVGAGPAADAFHAAWTIPGMLRRYVADEGLTGALIPALAEAERDEGTAGAQHLGAQILSGLLLVNAAIMAVVMAFPDIFVYLVASGFADDPEKFALTASMTRWLMPFVGMVSIVSFFEGVLNYRGHFLVPKVAPGIVSAGICASIVLLGSSFSEPAWSIVVGVWVGGIVHVLVHLPGMWAHWGPLRLTTQLGSERSRFVAQELIKVVGIGMFAQLNIIVLRSFTSWMPAGSYTHYTLATRVIDLTQGIIAVAIGGALLPIIVNSIVNEKWDIFRHDLFRALRLAAFLLIPCAVGMFLTAVPLTSMVFLSQKFGWNDVLWTASTVQVLVPFMLSVAGVNILKRVFFAFNKRNLVFVVGGLGVLSTGVFGWIFFDQGVVGLGLALSAATTLQMVAYIGLLKFELGDRVDFKGLMVPLLKMTLASVPMGIFAYWAVSHGHWTAGRAPANLVWFGVAVSGASVLYAVACWLLGVEELTLIADRLRKRVAR